MVHLLVVDDEVDIPILFKQRFRKEIKNGQWHFDFVFSGAEALEYFKNHDDQVQLILSDINMPGMNGLEMLRNLRKNQSGQRPVVIMVTAYGDEQNYQKAMEYGADAFMTKPLDFEELKKKLASHLQ
ncbi:MAG: response regulator [Saprospiraceae bacterium]